MVKVRGWRVEGREWKGEVGGRSVKVESGWKKLEGEGVRVKVESG